MKDNTMNKTIETSDSTEQLSEKQTKMLHNFIFSFISEYEQHNNELSDETFTKQMKDGTKHYEKNNRPNDK